MNFVRRCNFFRPQSIFISSADEILFHCGGTFVSAQWYGRTGAVVRNENTCFGSGEVKRVFSRNQP